MLVTLYAELGRNYLREMLMLIKKKVNARLIACNMRHWFCLPGKNKVLEDSNTMLENTNKDMTQTIEGMNSKSFIVSERCICSACLDNLISEDSTQEQWQIDTDDQSIHYSNHHGNDG